MKLLKAAIEESANQVNEDEILQRVMADSQKDEEILLQKAMVFFLFFQEDLNDS